MNIDWLSQSLAAISALVIGAIWYGPLFGKAWMNSAGLNMEKIKGGYHPAVLYISAVVLAFIVTIGLKVYIVDIHVGFNNLLGKEGEPISEYPFFHGAYHGLWIAFIYGVIPAIVTNALFNQRNWKFILIVAGYWLVTISLMGGIIGVLN